MDEEKLDTLQKRLVSARAASGLSQSALAKAAGMSQPTYSDLERGISKSTSLIVELAKALGVNALWLATGEGARTGTKQITEHPGLTGEQNLLLAASDGLDAAEMVVLINLATDIKREKSSGKLTPAGEKNAKRMSQA